jgi:hypothetical protein
MRRLNNGLHGFGKLLKLPSNEVQLLFLADANTAGASPWQYQHTTESRSANR